MEQSKTDLVHIPVSFSRFLIVFESFSKNVQTVST